MASRPAPTGATDSERLGRGDSSLLIRAIAMPEPEACAAWRKWRAAVDIDQLRGEELQVIPALGERLTGWLRDDPAAARFRGIVRRAWTETQLRLGTLRSITAGLEEAGCGPVLVTGSPAICLLNRLPDSIRPIADIRITVSRGSIPVAAEVIQAAGWRLSGELPAAKSLDWVDVLFFSRPDVNLMLQWRVLPAPPEKAAVVEAEFLAHSQRIDSGGVLLRTPGPEHALLAALCGRHDFDGDEVPWQVDAALLPLDGIVWQRWSELAEMLAPEAFDRLEQMRQLGLAAPRMVCPKPKRVSVQLARMRKFYKTWRGRGGRVFRRLQREVKSALGNHPR
jgi:hypothetical protein